MARIATIVATPTTIDGWNVLETDTGENELSQQDTNDDTEPREARDERHLIYLSKS